MELLAELVPDAVDEPLVDLNDLVLLLDLLVQRLPQVLDCGGDLHLLLRHYHASALLRHLRLEVLDHRLRSLHFLQQLAVLHLEPRQFLLNAVRHPHPLVLLRLQLPLDPLQFLLVLLLHDPEGVHEFLDDLQRFLDGVVALLAAGHLRPLHLPLLPLPVEILLELDDLVGQLLDLLLVDVREVIDVRIVKLLNRFRQFGIDVDEFLEGTLERDVLLVELAVLLPQVLDVR